MVRIEKAPELMGPNGIREQNITAAPDIQDGTNDCQVREIQWNFLMESAEAVGMDEPKPTIDFAACDSATCIVRMRGSFTCHDCPHPPTWPSHRGPGSISRSA